MNPIIDSAVFWALLGIGAIVAILLINVTFRAVFNERAAEQDRYPHRIGTQLPRTLHQGDHDEVLDLVHGNAHVGHTH